jgi:flagellar basal-body rod protein FlgB
MPKGLIFLGGIAVLGYLNRDLTIQVMEKGLDVASLRHRVISNNIANVATPGFKKSKVTFEEYLAKVVKRGATDLRSVKPSIVRVNTGMKEDGNNVDIDYEMAALSKNTIMYNAILQCVDGKFSILSSVLKEVR